MARSKEAFIKDCVLTSVADALESFSSIVEEVTAWAAEKQIPVVRDDVLKALQDLIDNGYVQAYICSANPPSTRAIPFKLADVEDRYFCLTDKGAATVKNIEQVMGTY